MGDTGDDRDDEEDIDQAPQEVEGQSKTPEQKQDDCDA